MQNTDPEATEDEKSLMEAPENIENREIDSPSENNETSEDPEQDREQDPEQDREQDREQKKGDHKFTAGQPLSFIRVRFPGNAKSHPFLMGKRKFYYGQKVVAMSDRGMTVGYVNSFPYELPFKESMLPIRTISKIASQEDFDEHLGRVEAEKKAERLCKEQIIKLKLGMVLTHVEIIHFGKKAVFYFNAPARVDFRDLVKSLVGGLKMRIELRQISVRDRAAALGAVGACGLQTCCSYFLKEYGNVSIKMAKNQNLSIIPSKINGVCGQLKCCTKYEDEVYTDKRKVLPKEGAFFHAENGDNGRITKLHVLAEQFEMLTDKGLRRRYAKTQIPIDKEDQKPPEGWRLPNSFGHIANETKDVIGAAQGKELVNDEEWANPFTSDKKEMSQPETEKTESAETSNLDDSKSDGNNEDVVKHPENIDSDKKENNKKKFSKNNKNYRGNKNNRSKKKGPSSNTPTTKKD